MPIPAAYEWVESAGRYRNLINGQWVSWDTVRSALEQTLSASQSTITTVSQKLVDGSISLAQWQLEMEKQVKLVNVISSALARGGWAQMTPSDWGWVGQRVRTQYQYLRNFANDIANGKQALNGRLVLRARMYAQSARSTFQEMRRRYMRIYKNAAFEARVLTPGAEHCKSTDQRPGCVELAAKGMQPIGTLPPIGVATCLTFCLCHFVFYNTDGVIIK